MFHFWRQPAVTWVALLAIVVSAALPVQLLADCCCVRSAATQSGCCQLQSDDSSNCCCAPATAPRSTCCGQSAAPTSQAACCVAGGGTSCSCTACGDAPEALPATTPRSDTGPQLDVTFLALPISLLPAPTVVVTARQPLSPDEGYLPPPVRERFCVWTI